MTYDTLYELLEASHKAGVEVTMGERRGYVPTRDGANYRVQIETDVYLATPDGRAYRLAPPLKRKRLIGIRDQGTAYTHPIVFQSIVGKFTLKGLPVEALPLVEAFLKRELGFSDLKALVK